jgi:hypothetical protein
MINSVDFCAEVSPLLLSGSVFLTRRNLEPFYQGKFFFKFSGNNFGRFVRYSSISVMNNFIAVVEQQTEIRQR